MCGEQFFALVICSIRAGSSPRVRGAARRLIKEHNLIGIIPACAGSRPILRSQSIERRDHPRVCGEQNMKAELLKTGLGSSPRVRGAGNDGVELV